MASEDRDMVEAPPHYADLDPQPRNVIRRWGLWRDHYRACALKYIARAGKKEDFVQDMRKAINYLEERIKLYEEEGV